MLNSKLLLLFLCTNAFAGTISGESGPLVFDDTLSQKDFTHQNLSSRTDMNAKTIYQSTFFQERTSKDTGCGWVSVFPVSVSSITFVNCNLDNVQLPNNATLIESSHRRIKVINGCDWEVDSGCSPIQKLDPSCG